MYDEKRHQFDVVCNTRVTTLSFEYNKVVTMMNVSPKLTNHATKGYSRLLEPHAASLLLTSFLSSGHPNRFPASTFTVELVVRNPDGTFPDKRLTVNMSEEEGG